jgi:alkanesulfonate monooxygenase SsuD/methylene tetrahydromethanopterin reductase-like flavin-dependent oxidoreductase (luciferase family)
MVRPLLTSSGGEAQISRGSSPLTARPEFHLFLPQMRMSMPTLVERARAAEAAGFTGMALMDHLVPPLAESHDMYEAMTTAGWLLAATERLTLSHLVLCDAFRHPAVLAREAVTLDHASGGRFELGIGWGSVPAEFETFGVSPLVAKARAARFAETLEVVRALWSGEQFDYAGEYHTLTAAMQRPVPLSRIPVIVGGAGARTLRQVAKHADWWNLPIYALDRLDELRPQAGSARVSTQEMIGYVASEARRAEVLAVAERRFGLTGMGRTTTIGTGDELRAHFARNHARGVDRFYVWFLDFGTPETLAGFGREVITPLRAGE